MIVVELKTIFSFEGQEIEYSLNGMETLSWPVHTLLKQTWEALSDLPNDTPCRGDWKSLKRRLMTTLGRENVSSTSEFHNGFRVVDIGSWHWVCCLVSQPFSGAMTCNRSLATTLRNSMLLIRRPLSWSIC